MQITKQQAGMLYGNSYLLQHVESGEVYSIIDLLAGDRINLKNIKGKQRQQHKYVVIGYEEIGTTYKILARPNILTKPIIVEGKEIVALVELANIAFPKLKDFSINDNKAVSKSAWLKLYYYHNAFKAVSLYGSVDILDQAALFEWLQSHNFQSNLPKELVTYNDDVYNS